MLRRGLFAGGTGEKNINERFIDLQTVAPKEIFSSSV